MEEMGAKKIAMNTRYRGFFHLLEKIQNPYWDEVLRVRELKRQAAASGDTRKMDSLEFYSHHELVKKYSYAISNPDAVAFVASWLGQKAIEIGCGTGYWGWLMEQMGIDMLCYDEKPPALVFDNEYHSPFDPSGSGRYLNLPGRHYRQVLQGTPEVLPQYPDRTLFLSWPTEKSEMATQCLARYRGTRLVYIGESRAGCTGTRTFFKALERNWDYVTGCGIEQWHGLNDHIFVYERR